MVIKKRVWSQKRKKKEEEGAAQKMWGSELCKRGTSTQHTFDLKEHVSNHCPSQNLDADFSSTSRRNGDIKIYPRREYVSQPERFFAMSVRLKLISQHAIETLHKRTRWLETRWQ